MGRSLINRVTPIQNPLMANSGGQQPTPPQGASNSPMWSLDYSQPNFSSPANTTNAPMSAAATPQQTASPAPAVQPAIETVEQQQTQNHTAKQVVANPVVVGQPQQQNGSLVNGFAPQQEERPEYTPQDRSAISSNPYQWLISKFGPQTPPMNEAERQRKEQNQAKIAGTLSLLTGIGNMLVTSSNRFGRSVQSPDFAKPVIEGIATNEKRRREEAAIKRDQDYKNAQIQLQRDKAAADAAEKRWNHNFKLTQEANKNKLDADKLRATAEDNEKNRKSREHIASDQVKAANARNAANLKQREKELEWKKQNGGGRGSGGNSGTIPISVGNGKIVDVPKNKWSVSTARSVYNTAVKEAIAASTEKDQAGKQDKNWFTNKGYSIDAEAMTDANLQQALSDYFAEFPNSAAVEEVKNLVNQLPGGFDFEEEDDDDLTDIGE